jgi:predicted Zn-dependent protease with MMP-like domain
MVLFGMRKSALSNAERARKIRFERLVIRVMRRLPQNIRSMLNNVEIVIEDEPTEDQREPGDNADELFGLYEGTPLTERGGGYSMALPDKITIFRRPIERACATPEEMADEVRVTVIHELAHHFGIEEDRIAELGWE